MKDLAIIVRENYSDPKLGIILHVGPETKPRGKNVLFIAIGFEETRSFRTSPAAHKWLKAQRLFTPADEALKYFGAKR